jgi:hypothetical protein
VCTRVEPEFTGTAVNLGGWVYVLQKLTLILDYASILEAGAVFHPGDVMTKQAGSTSVQTTNEYISPSDIIAVLDARHFMLFLT